jgi:hypothetical protein
MTSGKNLAIAMFNCLSTKASLKLSTLALGHYTLDELGYGSSFNPFGANVYNTFFFITDSGPNMLSLTPFHSVHFNI